MGHLLLGIIIIDPTRQAEVLIEPGGAIALWVLASRGDPLFKATGSATNTVDLRSNQFMRVIDRGLVLGITMANVAVEPLITTRREDIYMPLVMLTLASYYRLCILGRLLGSFIIMALLFSRIGC